MEGRDIVVDNKNKIINSKKASVLKDLDGKANRWFHTSFPSPLLDLLSNLHRRFGIVDRLEFSLRIFEYCTNHQTKRRRSVRKKEHRLPRKRNEIPNKLRGPETPQNGVQNQ
mgnify:CR=1 FL=1